MAQREDYPFLNRNAYRVMEPVTPGMRTRLSNPNRPHPPTPKPLDIPRELRAERARRVAGYTS